MTFGKLFQHSFRTRGAAALDQDQIARRSFPGENFRCLRNGTDTTRVFQTGVARRVGNRRRRFADRDQFIDLQCRGRFTNFAMAAFRFAAEFRHLAENSDAPAVRFQFDQRRERRLHRFRIRIVAVVDELHAADRS